jgi:hypothetical protein
VSALTDDQQRTGQAFLHHVEWWKDDLATDTGCRFRPRCPLHAALEPDSAAALRCATEEPAATAIGDGVVACHHAGR